MAYQALGYDNSAVINIPGGENFSVTVPLTKPFVDVVKKLEENGYLVICFLLDPRTFSVPQRRLRLYIAGVQDHTLGDGGRYGRQHGCQLAQDMLTQAKAHEKMPLDSFLLAENSAEYKHWDRILLDSSYMLSSCCSVTHSFVVCGLYTIIHPVRKFKPRTARRPTARRPMRLTTPTQAWSPPRRRNKTMTWPEEHRRKFMEAGLLYPPAKLEHEWLHDPRALSS